MVDSYKVLLGQQLETRLIPGHMATPLLSIHNTWLTFRLMLIGS